MKKALTLIVACILLAAMLVACNGNENTTTTGAPTTTTAAPTTSTNPVPTPKPTEPEAVLVEGIIVSTDDENGEGTKENPYTVTVAQGNAIEIPYVVQPKEAEDKSFAWSIVDEGEFGITFQDNGSKLTISVADNGASALVKGAAKDGSGVEVYIQVNVEIYNPVTGITASGLLASTEEGIDYVLVTALGTRWDMSDGILGRGQDLLDGKIFGGMQAPRNLTYYPALQNLGFTVAPAEATDPTLLVSYSNEGVIRVDTNGSWTALGAGETIVTVSSYTEPDVAINIKVVVKASLYAGILMEDYQNAPLASNSAWNLDADHATDAQFSRYDDWHLVMLQSNAVRGDTGIDNNQKIFYMGTGDRPYGICLENNVGEGSGGSLNDAAAMMWAKLTIPQGAVTFNIKIGNNDKLHGQYRVLFVEEDGKVSVLTNDWVGFTSGPSESTQKLVLPEAIKGKTGALVVEHRVTEYDNNAELQIKVMNFEGQVDVTGVKLEKSEGKYKPGQSFSLKATVSPANATNDGISYKLGDNAMNSGITIDAKTGAVVIGENTPAGEYHLIAYSDENNTITAVYTLTVTVEEIEVNTWNGKGEILDGVSDVKWTIDGKTDAGVGEGADLKIDGNEWSALVLDGRKIKETSYILTFGARVFHRDGETYPKFYVKINGEIVRGIGQTEDWFYVDTDATQYCSYDLSAWIGQTVKVEIGITQGTHAVVQYINFKGTAATTWNSKAELMDANLDPWAHTGDWDAGVGEGYDIKGEGSALYNSFIIGKGYNSQFTFGARVFHRDGETYPEIKLIVTDAAGEEHLIRAIGAEADTVYVDTDGTKSFTYDLCAFVGQEVKIAITLHNAATHCVIQYISMSGMTDKEETEKVDVNTWNGKAEILNGVSGIKWVIDGATDAGVGEGADLKIDGNEWSALVLDGRTVKEDAYILTFGARVFHRDGETYPKFYVKINGETVRGIGQTEDWFYVDTDATQYCSYDLSKWVGQTVKIEIGITQGTHAVVQYINFKGTAATTWNSKAELMDANLDPWAHTGDWDGGVGEGYDIKGEGSALYNSFIIGKGYNSQFTFGARVFHRDGETYPQIKLVVTDEQGVEHVIRAIGAEADTVYVDTDDTQTFTYDLSAFAGQEIKIAITLANGATHCVIQKISMNGAAL